MTEGYRIERAATAVLVVAAVIVALSALRLAFFSPASAQPDGDPPIIAFEPWEDALAIGATVTGSPDAPIKIVALMDLECPACAAFHRGLRQVMEGRAEMFQVLYIHYPLTYHSSALPAAKAALCAEELGKLEEWVAAVYDNQRWLGLREWETYASDAGIEATEYLSACAQADVVPQEIQAGIDFGRNIDLRTVPTVIMNGWRFTSPPSPVQLADAVDRMLTHGSPE